jgi:hypothetical protein
MTTASATLSWQLERWLDVGGDCLVCHQSYDQGTDHRANPEDPGKSCLVYTFRGRLVRVTRRSKK